MLKLVSTVAMAIALLVPGLLQAGEAAEPDLIAVKFHADWCGGCKMMGTTFADLGNKFDGQSVLFVTFDRTNRTVGHQSELLASALGLGSLYADNTGTGYILLLESRSHEVVGRLSAKDSMMEMASRIHSHLTES